MILIERNNLSNIIWLLDLGILMLSLLLLSKWIKVCLETIFENNFLYYLE